LSMIGTGTRKGYPLAFSEAIMRLMLANQTPVQVWLCRKVDYLQEPLMASGATDLRTPVAKAIQAGCKQILILSDGYENCAAGSLDQITNLKAVKQSGIKFHHINPVMSEQGGGRSLGSTIQPLTISGLDQLSSAAFLKQFESTPESFTGFLQSIFDKIEAGQIKAAKDIACFKDQPVQLLGGF